MVKIGLMAVSCVHHGKRFRVWKTEDAAVQESVSMLRVNVLAQVSVHVSCMHVSGVRAAFLWREARHGAAKIHSVFFT